ncbi:hypothetical protein SAMN02800692_2215 [Luteibacter sp. UNC138MFCol5.1]|nr:hypothetical protein SAMN02800692_2215 [Luteibacter sp. UNC138MFCol5.1]
MRMYRCFLLACIAMLGVLSACQEPGAERRTGEAVAKELQRRFDDTATDCGSRTSPAVDCSGVLLRGGPFVEGQHSWLPRPDQTAGISFSWLRQDANFGTPAWFNGYIVIPAQEARRLRLAPLTSMCIYVMNAATSSEKEDRCRTRCDDPTIGITTAAQFLERFEPGSWGCPFRGLARDGNDDVATAWMQPAEIRKAWRYFEWNEVIVAPWNTNVGDRMPLEAFFYLSNEQVSGLPDAKKDQLDFKDATGRWVPLILLTPAASMDERATFRYIEADQAILD